MKKKIEAPKTRELILLKKMDSLEPSIQQAIGTCLMLIEQHKNAHFSQKTLKCVAEQSKNQADEKAKYCRYHDHVLHLPRRLKELHRFQQQLANYDSSLATVKSIDNLPPRLMKNLLPLVIFTKGQYKRGCPIHKMISLENMRERLLVLHRQFESIKSMTALDVEQMKEEEEAGGEAMDLDS